MVCRWLPYSSSNDIDTSKDEVPSPSHQSTNNTSQTQHLTSNFGSKSWCPDTTSRRWRRGFPNSTLGWWNIGVLKKSPTGLYVYMNMPYHAWTVPVPCAHMQTTCFLPTAKTMDIEWHFLILRISWSCTSSDEDIPALEDPLYWKNSGLH